MSRGPNHWYYTPPGMGVWRLVLLDIILASAMVAVVVALAKRFL